MLLCALQPRTGALARGPVPRILDTQKRVVRPPERVRINRYQRERLSAWLAGAAPGSLDTLRIAAFQVQFQDVGMGGQPNGRPEVRDSTWFANELSHLRDYYRGASRGRMEITWYLDPTLYTMPEDMGYYGADATEESRVVELARTLVDSADAKVDFSKYDHVFIIHAGPGQETDLAGDSREQIWSSFYDRSDIDAAYPDTTVPGIITGDSLNGEPFHVNNFAIVTEDASQDFNFVGTLGIWAFQIGNRVGIVPLFDSEPPAAIDSQGVGVFDLMAYGLFNAVGLVPGFPSAFNRMLAGWVDPVTIDGETPATVNLADINTGADTDTLCIKIPITGNEYYLVVNRVHDANFDSLFTFVDYDSNLVPENTDSLGGAEFDFFLTDLTNPWVVHNDPDYPPGSNPVLFRYTGSGVYVWHVDENVIRETLSTGYLPNDFVDHKGVDLEEADGVQDLDRPGPSGFALGSHWDSYRDGDDNQNAIGPATKPNTASNSGIASGIYIEDISVPGPVMRLTVRREAGYGDTQRRWSAAAAGQPATVADIDAAGDMEIVVLADSAVYVFDKDGNEYFDADADPSTIEPYISVPGVRWAGPPAFADLDGGGDLEIVAASRDGDLYAWKADGTDLIPLSGGVLASGLPLAAPPLLVDIAGTPAPEIARVERDGDSLRVNFVDAAGQPALPADPAVASLWPAVVPGQYAAPISLARTADGAQPALTGAVIVSMDTLTARAHVTFVPVAPLGGAFAGTPPTWHYQTSATGTSDFSSPPAVGDIDGDGYDEIVLTMPSQRVLILEGESIETGSAVVNQVSTRSTVVSAPALGDVDGDGTLEIALWDREYMYLLKSNGRDMTDFPKSILPPPATEQPPTSIRRGYESPAIGDISGDGQIDVVFLVDDGSLHAFRSDGSSTPGFPRTGPAGPATPSLAPLSAGAELSLVTVGTIPGLRGADTVVDTFATSEEVTLSIQTLSGSNASAQLFWPMYQGDLARQGRPAS